MFEISKRLINVYQNLSKTFYKRLNLKTFTKRLAKITQRTCTKKVCISIDKLVGGGSLLSGIAQCLNFI